MNLDDFDYVEKATKALLKSNLSIPETVSKAMLLNYMLETDYESKRTVGKEIGELIALNSSRQLFSKHPAFHVPNGNNNGQIRIGRIVQGDNFASDFYVRLEDLQHAGIFAATYSGKTTFIATILTQLTKFSDPVPWMAFDFKRDLRGLCRNYDVKVLRWNWLKINPLQPPPGVEIAQWMTFLADIMAHVFGWFHASENYLMQFMQQAYSSNPASYPTLRELHDLVAVNEETGRRFSEYREVVINRLASMLIVLKDVIGAETSFPIDTMLHENVVIELDGLRRDEANFLVELFLAWIFSYRLASGHRGRISHLLVFDEASRFFFKGRQFRETTTELGIPFIDTVPQVIRDYKEGLLCAAQEPSLITHSLMSNLRTKFVGYLAEGEDIEAMCSSLNLDDDEKEELAKIGEIGYWLVKRAGEEPFVVKTEDFPIPKDMTDEELTQRMQPFLEQLHKAMENTVPARREKIIEEPRVVAPQISTDAWNLLVNVCRHPFLGIRSRCTTLRLSARRIEKCIAELAEIKYLMPVQLALGNFRPVKFLVPSNDALNLLSNVGHDTSLWRRVGRVGFEHSLYSVLIAYSFRKRGLKASIEKKLQSGRRLDVYIEGREKTGVEIELSTCNIEEKIRGIEELDRLVILVKDEQVFHDFVKYLGDNPNEKVRVARVIEFLRENSIRNSHGTSGTNIVEAEQT